jgi:hypothetical protein
MAIWIVYVALLMIWLEYACRASQDFDGRIGWRYDRALILAVTLFSMLHGPITTIFNARLAVSATSSTRYCPRTWNELFLTTDRAWSEVFGICYSYWYSYSTTRFSTVFFLFTLQTLICFGTPFLLNQGYDVQLQTIYSRQMRPLNAMAPAYLSGIDAYQQLSIGIGSLGTGSHIFQAYNSTSYIPLGAARLAHNITDIIFAGNTEGSDATLPGLRIQGGCSISHMNPTNESFAQACQALLQSNVSRDLSPTNTLWYSVDLDVATCLDDYGFQADWMTNGQTAKTAKGVMRLDARNETGSNFASVSEAIACVATFSTVSVRVFGRTGVFDTQTIKEEQFYDSAAGQQGEPLIHPLSAAMMALQGSDGLGIGKPTAPSLVRMWNYTTSQLSDDPNQIKSVRFQQPTAEEMAQTVWQAIVHMTGSIAVSATRGDQMHEVTAYRQVTGRRRKIVWAIPLYAFLALWLALNIYLFTQLGWRVKTYDESLGSYTTSRLFVEHAHLVDDQSCGTLENNRALSTGLDAAFTRVGGKQVGGTKQRICVGGEEDLDPSVQYV